MKKYKLNIAGKELDIPEGELLKTLSSMCLHITDDSGKKGYPLFPNVEQVFDKDEPEYVIFLEPNKEKIVI